jgi:Family of unknown function (DUF6328)
VKTPFSVRLRPAPAGEFVTGGVFDPRCPQAGNTVSRLAFHKPVINKFAAMSEKVDRKLKTALDETRLLILGVQILLGFEFQCVFQDGFDGLKALRETSRYG